MKFDLQSLTETGALFEEFYAIYPKKVGRKDAERAWRKLKPEQKRKAVDTLPSHKRYWDACQTEKPFIPYPATWLNGWRFDDEIEMPKSPEPAWWTTDQGICAKAAQWCVSTGGKSRQQLIDEIRSRERAFL